MRFNYKIDLGNVIRRSKMRQNFYDSKKEGVIELGTRPFIGESVFIEFIGILLIKGIVHEPGENLTLILDGTALA